MSLRTAGVVLCGEVKNAEGSDSFVEGSLNSNFRQYGELKSRDEKQMR